MTATAVQWLPTVGGSVLLVVGLAAAFGYARTQAQRVWRESAEGWKAENEANKERADRLATQLQQTVADLNIAHSRTDITVVLKTLERQHKEATEALKDADLARAEIQQDQLSVLRRIADESATRNGAISEALSAHAEEEAKVWKEALKIAVDTLKTVEALRRDTPTPVTTTATP